MKHFFTLLSVAETNALLAWNIFVRRKG